MYQISNVYKNLGRRSKSILSRSFLTTFNMNNIFWPYVSLSKLGLSLKPNKPHYQVKHVSIVVDVSILWRFFEHKYGLWSSHLGRIIWICDSMEYGHRGTGSPCYPRGLFLTGLNNRGLWIVYEICQYFFQLLADFNLFIQPLQWHQNPKTVVPLYPEFWYLYNVLRT